MDVKIGIIQTELLKMYGQEEGKSKLFDMDEEDEDSFNHL